MSEERRKKIIADHPLLYRKYIYFECLDGWLTIIENLSHKLESMIQRQIEKYPNAPLECYCTQVKEKYGALSFYMTYETGEMHNAIDECENLSAITCEVCCDPGKVSEKPWYRTRCPRHVE